MTTSPSNPSELGSAPWFRNPKVLAPLGVLVLAAIYMAVSAAGSGPEDDLDAIADQLIGPIDEAHLQRGLALLDTDAVPFQLQAFGETRVYGRDSAQDLAAYARRALAPFFGVHLRTIRRGVEVEGDRGQITTQLMSDRGMFHAVIDFRQVDGQWKIAALTLRR